MKNFYLYVDNQNDQKLTRNSKRFDTPYQLESNYSYYLLKKECKKKKINFDFLLDNNIKKNDYVIFGNVYPFLRNNFLDSLINIKKKISIKFHPNKKSYFENFLNQKRFRYTDYFFPYLWESKGIIPQNWDINIHHNFDKILTWDASICDYKKYFLLNLQTGPIYFDKKLKINLKPWDKRSFFISSINNNKINFNNSNLYLYRINLFSWFANNHPNLFNLYGGGWLKAPEYIGDNKYSIKNSNNFLKFLLNYNKDQFKNVYKGTLKSKKNVLSNSKFNFCLENNSDSNFYITEKLFASLFNGAVPIYYGAKNIDDILPQNAFINLRDYENNFDDLYQYLVSYTSKDYKKFIESVNDFLNYSNYVRSCCPEGIAEQIERLVYD